MAANADQHDLDGDGLGDICDPETIVTANATLPAGEYTFINLTITNSSTLTLESDSSRTGYKGVVINTENLTINAGSSISADGMGYRSGQGPGGAGYTHGGTYGGKGGNNDAATYGSALAPTDLGSGGGHSWGGGAIRLDVSGALTADGTISANGATSGSATCRTFRYCNNKEVLFGSSVRRHGFCTETAERHLDCCVGNIDTKLTLLSPTL